MRINTWNLSEETDVIFVLIKISGGGGEALDPPLCMCVVLYAPLTTSAIPVV